MQSFVETRDVSLAESSPRKKLRSLDKDPTINAGRTVLIKINDPSSRTMNAEFRDFPRKLSDQEVKDEFNAGSWKSLPNISLRPDEQSELDINVGEAGNNSAVLVAFKLAHPDYDDRFHHPDDPDASEAIFRIEGEANVIFNSRWVDSPKIISADVIHSAARVNYVLGVNVDGEGSSHSTATLIDPKIENNG